MQENTVISYKSLVCALFSSGYPMSKERKPKQRLGHELVKEWESFNTKRGKGLGGVAEGNFKKSCKKTLNYVLFRKA